MNATVRLRVLPQILPEDGRSAEFQVTETHIQWRYAASSTQPATEWQDLIALADLIGPPGPGTEFRVDDGFIQYRSEDEDDWIDLLATADLKGDPGNAATISVAGVTTLSAGENATVENVGSENAAELQFGIPAGPAGPPVSDGNKGDVVVSEGGAVWEVAPDLKALPSNSPFGRAGMKVLKGLENDAHYGFNNAILDAGNGKWVVVYRKAPNHAVTNGSEIRAFDTYDQGETIENERLIFTDPSYDTRNFVARVMADGRFGIIAARRASGTLNYTSSVFIYSDDFGGTWSSTAVSSPSAGWGVNFHGSMIDHPSDADGFIAYSYGHTGGHIDALVTTNNGASWSWTTQVASPSGGFTALSECAPVRVGTQNKWLLLCRTAGNAVSFASSNPLSFGVLNDTGLPLAGNPPQAFFDEGSNKVWYVGFVRRGRGVVLSGNMVESAMLLASANGDALFSAGGVMTSLGRWNVHAYLPDWSTGYIHPFFIDGRWWATFVCGEDYPNHNFSRLCLLGDFIASGSDTANLANTGGNNGAFAGKWTPTLTNVANIASSSALEGTFQRIGNIVTCWGVFVATCTAAANTSTTLRLSLPIPSNFTASIDGRGVSATTAAHRGGVCNSDIASDAIHASWASESTNNLTWTFYFSYEVK